MFSTTFATARKRAALLGAFAVAVSIGAASAAPASAVRHLRLLRSAPAADSVLAVSPSDIRLWFSETPELRTIRVELANAGGQEVALGEPTRAESKDAPVVAALTAPIPAGQYKVSWRSMSKDGHVVKGDFDFRVRSAP